MVLVFATSNIFLSTLVFPDWSVLIAHSRFGRYFETQGVVNFLPILTSICLAMTLFRLILHRFSCVGRVPFTFYLLVLVWRFRQGVYTLVKSFEVIPQQWLIGIRLQMTACFTFTWYAWRRLFPPTDIPTRGVDFFRLSLILDIYIACHCGVIWFLRSDTVSGLSISSPVP